MAKASHQHRPEADGDARVAGAEVEGTADSGGPGLSPLRKHPVCGYARMSAVSGILFAVLFAVALVLVARAPGPHTPDSGYAAFYAGDDDVLATVGLYVVPFAGIAFLWHLAATRAMYRELPGQRSPLPGWLQLASGLVFLCMMFAGSAAVGAVALLSELSVDPLPSAEVARALSGVGYGLMFVFGVRLAGMYMITTTTLARTAGVAPGWMTMLGYLAAAFLLVSTTFHPAVLLVFPVWVVLVGVVVLLRAGRRRAPDPPQE